MYTILIIAIPQRAFLQLIPVWKEREAPETRVRPVLT